MRPTKILQVSRLLGVVHSHVHSCHPTGRHALTVTLYRYGGYYTRAAVTLRDGGVTLPGDGDARLPYVEAPSVETGIEKMSSAY